tara:strand:+ start:342 stop:794 length:453 start_codon:yes stop_codon:yes gene_type:complete
MAYSPNYQDILSSQMSQMAPSANQYQQASTGVQKNMIQRQFNRDQMGRDYTRARSDLGRQRDQAFRQLPGAFNRRGMLDSGAYIRSGRETAANVLRAQNRMREDQGQAMMGSLMQDQLDLGNLAGLREQLSSADYQNLVASLYGNQMRGA